jgi:hypothetical protein
MTKLYFFLSFELTGKNRKDHTKSCDSCSLVAAEGRSGVYNISEQHMKPQVVKLLLEWMYLKEVTVPRADLLVSFVIPDV